MLSEYLDFEQVENNVRDTAAQFRSKFGEQSFQA